LADEHFKRVVYKPVQYGALTQLFAGTSPSITEAKSGSYLVPLAKFTDKLPHPQGYDDEMAKKVWDWNMEAMAKAEAA